MKKSSVSENFTVTDCIVRYPHVFAAQQAPNSTESKFSIKIYVDPMQVTTMHQTALALAKLHFQNSEYDQPNFKWPYVAANQKPADAAIARIKDRYAMNPKASVDYPPAIVENSPEKQPIKDHGQIYSGCICAVAMRFYTFEKMGNVGIGAGLIALMKLADGETIEDNVPDVNTLFDNVTPTQAPSFLSQAPTTPTLPLPPFNL